MVKLEKEYYVSQVLENVNWYFVQFSAGIHWANGIYLYLK